MFNVGAVQIASPVSGAIYLGILILTVLIVLWGFRKQAIRKHTALVIVALAMPAEYVLGSRRFALFAALGHLVSAPIALIAARGIEETGLNRWGDDLMHSALISPVGWIFAAAGVASGYMSRLWGRRVRVIIFTLSFTMLLYSGTLSDFLGVTAALLGTVVGIVLTKNVHGGQGASVRERRILTATMLGAVAVGPVLVALNPMAEGPFSAMTQLLWLPSEHNTEIIVECAAQSSQECADAMDIAAMRGVGPAVANLIPLVIQLVLCLGLIRGRRLAWILSLAAQLVMVVFLVFQLRELQSDGYQAALYGLNLASVVLPWVLGIAVLIVNRRVFGVASDSRMVRKASIIVAATVAVTALVWLFGGLMVAFRPAATVASLLQELPLRYLPPVVGTSLPDVIIPDSPAAWFLYEWVGNIFWLTVAFCAYKVFHAVPDATHEAQRVAARDVLKSGTGDHISWMTLWEGNRYFFNDGGYVAYRVHNNVALTLGEPIVGGNQAGTKADVADQFEHFASDQSWRTAWYSVGADFAQSRPGFRRVEVAEEAVLNCDNTEFKGKKFQNVRTARNKAGKEGITALWIYWHDLDPILRGKCEALSEQWVGDKALPEMGFTLGGLQEMQDPDTRLLLAVGEDGMLHAMTSWMPVYRDGQICGYTLDVMRRHDEGFPGAIDFLVSEAVIIAAGEGCEFVSMSGAPLAGDGGDEPGLLDLLLDRVGQEMEPLYGFRSLAAAKHKFQPEERPWYLCYEDELSLPSIGMAVSHAYLPELGMSDAVSAVKLWLESKRSLTK